MTARRRRATLMVISGASRSAAGWSLRSRRVCRRLPGPIISPHPDRLSGEAEHDPPPICLARVVKRVLVPWLVAVYVAFARWIGME
jgi:hypothetical protein